MSGNDPLYLMVVTVFNFCYNRSSPEFAISETNASLDFLAPKWYYWSKQLSEYWPMNGLNINSTFGVFNGWKKKFQIFISFSNGESFFKNIFCE